MSLVTKKINELKDKHNIVLSIPLSINPLSCLLSFSFEKTRLMQLVCVFFVLSLVLNFTTKFSVSSLQQVKGADLEESLWEMEA